MGGAEEYRPADSNEVRLKDLLHFLGQKFLCLVEDSWTIVSEVRAIVVTVPSIVVKEQTMDRRLRVVG